MASYLSVVIAAIGLVMVPVHVAAYRERGVLRRFTAAGFPRWSFAAATLAVGVVLTAVGSVVMLAVAAPVYGLPPVHDPVRTVLAALVGALAFTSIGLLIGSLVPNARAAQGLGLLAFFPSFLLGGGGPPPSVMGEQMRQVADLLPLTHVLEAVRDPWLGLGPAPATCWSCSPSWPPPPSAGGAPSGCDPDLPRPAAGIRAQARAYSLTRPSHGLHGQPRRVPVDEHSQIGRWIGRAAIGRGGATYLADARGPRTVTYRELGTAVDRWDQRLDAAGVAGRRHRRDRARRPAGRRARAARPGRHRPGRRPGRPGRAARAGPAARPTRP